MIRCGIAGLGKWGRVLVDSVQDESEEIVFTAGVTGHKQNAAEYCEDNDIDLRDTLDDLLSDDEIDAIVLATPHTMHTEQIIACAKAGKPLLVEKPMTLKAADARRAAQAMQEAGKPLCVGFNRRFLPTMQKLVDLAQSGTLGTVIHAEGNISGNGGLRYSTGHWRATEKESPAGGMTAMGVHMMDAMISVLGHVDRLRAVSECHALTTEVDDTTFASLKFKSGVTGVLTTLYATRQLWRIQVFGTKGWAEVRDNEILEVRMIDGDCWIDEFPGFDMERAELEAFADTVANGTPFAVPVEDAVHGIEILEGIVKASKEDCEVSLG